MIGLIIKKIDLQKSKTKFKEHIINDWVEIPDYKMSILEELQTVFKLEKL